MKKILLFAVAAVLGFASCTKALEDRVTALENDVETIQKQLAELTEKLNSEVNDLKALIDALENKVYVTGVSEIKEGDKVVGYTITLSKGQALTIYHGTDGKNGINGTNGNDGKDGQDGKDAVAPTVSVVLENGVYYWAVNGEILTDANGNKVAVYAESDAPEFKYENGQWWISVDGTWSPLASGNSGDSTFSDVQYDDASVTFVLANGTEIVLPRQAAFSLNIASAQVAVLPGATVNVAYTITGATENTTVYAVADGGYSVKVEAKNASEGALAITAPDPLTDGKVVVFAGDNTKAAMQVLSFEEGALTVTGDTFTVEAEGGVLEVPVMTNLDYEVEVSADWVTYTETKAMREETLVFNVAANSGAERAAKVALKVNGTEVQSFKIAQKTSMVANFELNDLIGDWNVYFNNGLKYTWTFGASDDASKGNATLVNIFGKNTKNIKVYVNFDLQTGVISIATGQACEDDYGWSVNLAAGDGSSVIEYTMTEKGKFGNPTAEIGYKDAWSSKYLSNVYGEKVDPNALAVGNYYYADGTCTATFVADKDLVGVVCWLGNITSTDPALKAAFPDCKNGLVMSAKAISDLKWQTNVASVSSWQADYASSFTSIQVNYSNGATNLDKALGYNNTQVLRAYNAENPETAVDVCTALDEFAAANPAPAGTSGWYIPSVKEVSYICCGANDNAWMVSGTANMNVMNTKIEAAGLSKITWSNMASSSEISSDRAYAYQSNYVGNPDKTGNFTLCPVFAF